MAGAEGIEPTTRVLETLVIPLHHAPMEPEEGIEPSTSSLPWRRSTTELPRPKTSLMVPGIGFEPMKAYANRFTVCSIWPLWYPGK